MSLKTEPRLLTSLEVLMVKKQHLYNSFLLEWDFVQAIQRKFIEVNGLESSSLILEREEAGGETSDSSHLAVPTNGPESLGEAA